MDKHNKKVALITGSTGSLGIALCKKLYEEGYRVVGNYRSYEKSALLRKTLHSMNCRIDLVKGNITDFWAVGRMVETVEKEVGPIDILINNASRSHNISFLRMEKSDWNESLDTNLTGIFNCSRHVIKGMMRQRYGRIINICSRQTSKEADSQVNFAVARAGIHGFTQSLAREVAAYGITVNAIFPDFTHAEMAVALPEVMRENGAVQTPSGQNVLDEITEAVSYLISGKSGFITGHNIQISGSPQS